MKLGDIMKGINKNNMSYHNRVYALNTIYQSKQISKKELAGELGLTISSISKIIADLENGGYLISTGKLLNSCGKHQGYWSINPERDFYLCLITSPSLIKAICPRHKPDMKAIHHLFGTTARSQQIIKQHWQCGL